ncbi:MAG: TetR/AcrR family transcriptional regulator [Coriobacteriia bacterium]|nr:TetR/AcrR family transcriptional regulator [Coriobacteriia bacterium]
MPSTEPTTRDRILECAEELFGRRGYDAASIADIAQACGVSTGLIYYHYTDKESLLRALVERAGTLFGPPTRTALEGEGSPTERLAAFIEARVRVTLEHHNLVRILMRPMTDPEGALAGEVLAGISQSIQAIASVIAEGIETGEFEPVDPYLAAESLFALLHTRVVAGALAAPHSELVASEPADLAAFITGLFLQGITRC